MIQFKIPETVGSCGYDVVDHVGVAEGAALLIDENGDAWFVSETSFGGGDSPGPVVKDPQRVRDAIDYWEDRR